MCRFAILNCEDTEKWRSSGKERPNVEGHINRFVEMFADTYGEANDQWKAYSCYDFEWPSVKDAQTFDAVFITGSHYSVYDESQTWISELCRMVQLYVQEDVTVVGICFGTQILGTALGGCVGKNPGIFVAKVEEIEVLPQLSQLIGEDVKWLNMIESHGDQVLELPEDAVCLATSKSCANEIWCLRSALAIQAHPEFVPGDLINKILPSLKQRRILSAEQVRQYEKNLKTKKPDHSHVINLVKKFTRSADLSKSRPYRSLFPSRLNSKSDAELIQQIKQRAEDMAMAHFTESSAVRNPEVDRETKELVHQGMEELTGQFSTLMLKELKRAMVDYDGLKMGNEVVHENAKSWLNEALDLHQPIKELRTERLKMTEEINQVLKHASEMISSLEESAQLLEKQTGELRRRLLPGA